MRIERLEMFLNVFAGFVNLRKSFYIHWSAGRSPRVHKVNPGRDPSMIADSLTKGLPPKVFHQHTASMGVILYEDIQF